MSFDKDVFQFLDQINNKEKKSKQDLEALDDAVKEILRNQDLTDRFCSTVQSGTKWNPSVLSAFSKVLVSKCQTEGLDETKKQMLLLLLKSNHRGKWSNDLCRGLSFLLREGVPEANYILRLVVEKTRSSKDREIWEFYDSHFSSLLSPMGGLPHLLTLSLEIWPEPANPQLQTVLAKLIDKFNKAPVRSLMKQAEEVFTSYLERRSLDQSKPLDLYEPPLLELLRKQNLPAWEGHLRLIQGHRNTIQETGKILEPATTRRLPSSEEMPSQQTSRPKASQPDYGPSNAGTVSGHSFDEIALYIEPNILEPLEQSRQEFVRNLSVLTSEYKRVLAEYKKKVRALEKREEKVFELTEAHLALESKISNLNQKIRNGELLAHQLEQENKLLVQKCHDAEKRADERVHQIRIQAKNELSSFKHNLWMRLRPDLEDLIREGIGEDDYATADRGRSLFRRFQDLIRSLRVFEIIPKKTDS